jgi:hypothetical protein
LVIPKEPVDGFDIFSGSIMNNNTKGVYSFKQYDILLLLCESNFLAIIIGASVKKQRSIVRKP